MKKIVSGGLLLSIASFSYAQVTPKPVTKPATPPISLKSLTDSANYALGLSFANFCKQQGHPNVNASVVMKAIDDVFGKTKIDSASYAMGLSFANFYKEQGVTAVNKSLISKGLSDGLGNKKTLLDEVAANSVMNSYLTKIQQAKSQPNIDAGNAFLAKNKLRPEVKTTGSGLQYEILREGTGSKPSPTDTVVCHYRGTLLNGTSFDDSYGRGQPITFRLNQMIAGWIEALQLMPAGSKYKLYVPYTLGYGAFDYGPIPGGSMLTFEVELLEVRK